MQHALLDYYRCPAEVLKHLALTGGLSADAGFFRFGPEILYGRSCAGSRSRMPAGALFDTLPQVGVGPDGMLRLPFEPSEVADDLRLERYAVAQGSRPSDLGQAAYYTVRSFLPSRLKQYAQRTYLRNYREISFPSWPVDMTVDRLLERLLALALRSQGLTRVPFVWFWPDGAPSCAMMTHDVDTAPGRDNCGWLMDADDAHGIKSSFQIVPEERYAVTARFLDGFRSRGFEIDIHDLNHDGRLFSSREEFARRAPRINAYARDYGARGFRSGALHRRQEWYDALEVAYDMSVPNMGHLDPQRGGCCTVMPHFVGRILELPVTTTQDYSLFHILNDFSGQIWRTQIDAIMARHGLVSFIVHPDYLWTDRAREAYRTLLEQLASLREARRSWIALPGDVERWWRDRSQMILVRDGEGWRIEGRGKERARVAWAELQGDGLAYRVEPASPDGDGAGRA
jgi:hypothetical protein